VTGDVELRQRLVALLRIGDWRVEGLLRHGDLMVFAKLQEVCLVLLCVFLATACECLPAVIQIFVDVLEISASLEVPVDKPVHFCLRLLVSTTDLAGKVLDSRWSRPTSLTSHQGLVYGLCQREHARSFVVEEVTSIHIQVSSCRAPPQSTSRVELASRSPSRSSSTEDIS
jgi:hypothetical protein